MTAIYVAIWYANAGEQVELKAPELADVTQWVIAQISGGESFLVVVWKGSRRTS